MFTIKETILVTLGFFSYSFVMISLPLVVNYFFGLPAAIVLMALFAAILIRML